MLGYLIFNIADDLMKPKDRASLSEKSEKPSILLILIYPIFITETMKLTLATLLSTAIAATGMNTCVTDFEAAENVDYYPTKGESPLRPTSPECPELLSYFPCDNNSRTPFSLYFATKFHPHQRTTPHLRRRSRITLPRA